MENVLALGDPQIDISVKVDHGLQIIHVLDLDQGGCSLTIGIGDHQAEIFRKMSIIGNLND